MQIPVMGYYCVIRLVGKITCGESINFRGSRPEVLCKNSRSENFGKLLGKCPWWGSILIKFWNEVLKNFAKFANFTMGVFQKLF